MPASTYLRSYRKNGLETDLSVADGHRVIQLLYQGLIDAIVRAKASIENNDINQKAKQIDKALRIVAGLDTSVMYDPKDANQAAVAKNFKNLYAIFTDRLMLASSKLSTEPLDEILVYARQVKSAWDQIPESAKQEGYALQRQRDLATGSSEYSSY
ncbi:MAG: flagellar export chaperone FliS [Succinivibrionaceae bacterium]|nr:flagellar export chaperone FliS [Succinivibrionaceae bacterium]